MATPRSNSACTLGAQEVGKTTLPRFSSCWPIAPLPSAAVIRPAANKVRPDFLFIVSALSGLRARHSARLLDPPRRRLFLWLQILTVVRVSSEGLTMRSEAGHYLVFASRRRSASLS